MKIIDFIVCDDIRQEASNKVTLVGVYDRSIMLQAGTPKDEIVWPLRMKLCFYCRFTFQEDDVLPDHFEVEYFFNGEKKTSAEGRINKPSPADVISKILRLSIIGNGFPIYSIGELGFNVKFMKENDVLYEITPDFKMQIGVAENEIKQVSVH